MGAKRRCGLAVVAIWLIALGATLPDIGLTDDADAYVGASAQYAGWWSRVLSGDRSALSRTEIDRAWQPNAEHPPLAKLAMGASWWLFFQRLGWMGQVSAARVSPLAERWAG